METRGNAVAYSGGTTHIPLPKATDQPIRTTHTPRPAVRTGGLNFDALRPKCRDCGQPSGQLNDASVCPTCRGEEIRAKRNPGKVTTRKTDAYVALPDEEIERRFTADTTRLGRELAELEHTDPDVAAAAASYDNMVERVTQPEQTPQAPARRPGRVASFDVDAAMRRYAAGEPAGTIAADVGCAVGTIHSHASRRGIHRGQEAPQTPQAADQAPSHSLPEVEPALETVTPCTAPAPRPAAPTHPVSVTTQPVSELDRQLAHVSAVLRSTADHDHPAVRMLRLNALSAVEALHLLDQLTPRTPAPAAPSLPVAGAGHTSPGPIPATPELQRPGGDTEGAARKGKAAAPSTTPRKRPARPRANPTPIVEAYTAGRTIPQIHATTGHSTSTIRRILLEHGITLRDDRHTNSGGGNRFNPDPDTLAEIIRLYTDERLSANAIGNRFHVERRTIQRLLTNNGVTIRPPVHLTSATEITPEQAADIATAYVAGTTVKALAAKYHLRNARVAEIIRAQGREIRPKGASTHNGERIRALGITAKELRAWAVDNGLAQPGTHGLVPNSLIDAYAAAHPTPQEDIAS